MARAWSGPPPDAAAGTRICTAAPTRAGDLHGVATIH